MTTSLHTDTYYRGYRLATDPDNTVVYWGPEQIDIFDTPEQAKETIDTWLNAK